MMKCNRVMPDLVPQLSIVDCQGDGYRADSLDDDEGGSYNSEEEEIIIECAGRFTNVHRDSRMCTVILECARRLLNVYGDYRMCMEIIEDAQRLSKECCNCIYPPWMPELPRWVRNRKDHALFLLDEEHLVISRAPGLKLVVQTLLSSLRPIGNIVLICCTFFIIFGILGVQLFKGKFFYCDGPDVQHVRNKTQCQQDSRNEWQNQKYNFDNLGQALMALFVLSSKDGWVQIMYTGIDAVGIDQQPIENFDEWRLLYFISFLLLVGFFVLNMFVGVVVENFHKCRATQEREERALREAKRQRKLEKRRKKLKEPPYYINFSPARFFIHNICTSKYFDLAIAAVIGLNVITMAMEFYMMPDQLVYALKIFNYFFTSVFILESIVKSVALGVRRYFSDSHYALLKLLKMAKGIRALLDTVMQALPQVGNLGLLFFLLFFIFAALGVELFGRLECSDEHPCEGLSDHAHFKEFGMAFLTLFRVATGDNWNGIMKDTLRDGCNAESNCTVNCCVSPFIAPIYFVIFVLMAQFVLVNVVVAVLMKHLEESHKHMDDDAELEAEIKAELEDLRREELRREASREQESSAGDSNNRDNGENGSCHDNGAQGNNDEDAKDDKRRRSVERQSSLPSGFTYCVRPPSPYPQHKVLPEEAEESASPSDIYLEENELSLATSSQCTPVLHRDPADSDAPSGAPTDTDSAGGATVDSEPTADGHASLADVTSCGHSNSSGGSSGGSGGGGGGGSVTPSPQRKHPHNVSKRSLPDRLRVPRSAARPHRSVPNVYDYSNYLDASLVRALQQARRSAGRDGKTDARTTVSPSGVDVLRGDTLRMDADQTESTSRRGAPCAVAPTPAVLAETAHRGAALAAANRNDQSCDSGADAQKTVPTDTLPGVCVKPLSAGKYVLSGDEHPTAPPGRVGNHVDSRHNCKPKRDDTSRHCDNDSESIAPDDATGLHDSLPAGQMAPQSMREGVL
ncbi:PREDICTED: voltage-dependent T-type calcium channel subunit alpha-1H-like [Priapulus caudatus]|uniref:Voltage-dependent T-type calcium channel subunit alpha-1H-like n=1 Tax=Priapulus caudatus TaxID=37621 RepID=A0ABM1F312_PRICU|nr:PREDICTED: voltage-dependent T-type calcium channel subunit alpha-1H-like [Priapulus caudatus]